MESLGEYLYILVFAGIIIFNFLKKAKAKPAPLPKPVEYEEEEYENPFEEIMQQYDVLQQPEPAKVVELNPVVKPQITPRKTQLKQTKTSNATNNPVEDFQTINIDFSNEEELRKGIIFSEIFNRKYS